MQAQLMQDDLFKRIHELDQRLQYIERREQEGWRVASQQISQISENSRSSTAVIANLELKLSRDIQFIEDTVAKEIQTESQRRSDTENRLRQSISDEAGAIRSAVITAEQSRFQDLDRRVNDLTTGLSELCSVFEERLDQLTGSVKQSLDVTRNEAARVEELLIAHKQQKEQEEVKLLTMLEEACVQLHQQIVQERNERQESHRRLERMLLEIGGRQWVRA